MPAILPSLQTLKSRAARAKARLFVHSEAAQRWRDWCWPSATADEGLEILYRDRYDVLGRNRLDLIGDERARDCFREQDRQWRFQEDLIYRASGPVTIEPKYSLAYLPGRHLIEPVRGVHRELVPSLVGDRVRRASGKGEHYDALLHFDGFLGKNVWHFFADAFNPMLLLDRTAVVPADTPILIHRRIWERPLAQFLLTQPPFAGRRWIVQDEGQWITAGVMYKAICTLALFRNTQEFIGGFVAKRPSRRIFLDRRPVYGRRVANHAEAEQILGKHGFETVYCEDLSFEGQVALFSEVSHVVGIHGAGLTNLLFSDIQSVRCLEILPEEYLNPHYYWLLQVLGARKYDAIVGSRFDADLNFTIDISRFEQQVERLMA